MNKRTITCEQMAAAFYSREPIGDWYVTSMTIKPALPLPLTKLPGPNEITFMEGDELIIFTVEKKA